MQDSESSTKEQICSSIFSLPLQLCAEDIEDFFSLANYYASRTPQSFRKVRVLVLHNMPFHIHEDCLYLCMVQTTFTFLFQSCALVL